MIRFAPFHFRLTLVSRADASRIKAQMQKAPGACFSSDAHLADGWGLRVGFAKVSRRSGQKSTCILKGVAQQAPQHDQQQPVQTRASVMPAAGLQCCEGVIRDNLV